MIYILERIPQGSKVYDGNCIYIVDMDILKLLNEWCMGKGSTYEGRKQAACYILHIKQKAPILISSRDRDIMFPIRNTRNERCVFLNARAIEHVQRIPNGSKITFINGTTMNYDVDIRVIKRELYLCETLLEKIL